MQKNKRIIRDILFLGILIFLLFVVHKRTKSFIKLHKNSITHQLDMNFADQLYAAQKHLRILTDLVEEGYLNDTYLDRIDQSKKILQEVEDKYTTNSPGTLLLGPFCTVAIVIKEKQLTTKLLKEINEAGNILNDLTSSFNIPNLTTTKESSSIATGLKRNQSLITAIRQVSKNKTQEQLLPSSKIS